MCVYSLIPLYKILENAKHSLLKERNQLFSGYVGEAGKVERERFYWGLCKLLGVVNIFVIFILVMI